MMIQFLNRGAGGFGKYAETRGLIRGCILLVSDLRMYTSLSLKVIETNNYVLKCILRTQSYMSLFIENYKK